MAPARIFLKEEGGRERGVVAVEAEVREKGRDLKMPLQLWQEGRGCHEPRNMVTDSPLEPPEGAAQ